MLSVRERHHEQVSDSDASGCDIERTTADAASETMSGANDQANRVLLPMLAAIALSLSSISAPAFAGLPLEDDVCQYQNSSPEFFDLEQSERRWAAVAVNPSGSDNKDLQLRIDTGQFQVTLATSSSTPGTDFIIGDFNHNYLNDYLAYVYGGSTDSNYRVQWDSGGEMTVGTTVSGTIGSSAECGLLRVWDLHLRAGRSYRFIFRQEGTSGVRLALFKNPTSGSYWGTRGSWEFMRYPGNQPQVYTVSGNDDDYGVVVYAAPSSMSTGSFTLLVEDVTPCVSMQPSYCQAFVGLLPRCLELPTGTGSWVGYAIAPEAGDSKDLCVHTGPNGAGDQVACSVSNGTNFVIGDYNNAPPTTIYPLVSGGSNNATYVVQWERGPETLEVGELLESEIAGGSTGDCMLFQVYDLALEAGRSYHFIMASEPGVRLALFRNLGQGVYWGGRDDSEFELGSGEQEYTAPADGDYAVVIFTEDLSTSNQSFSVVVAPRLRLDEDLCAGSTMMPTLYSVSQTRNHWAAFAVKGNLPTQAVVALSGVPSLIPLNAHAGTSMEFSGFVVGDFNHNQTGEYFGYLYGPVQPYDHVADWDSGDLIELGESVHGSLGQSGNDCRLIEMHDVALEEDRCYRITLSTPTGIAARVTLFENPTAGAYWAADEDALFNLAAAATPYIFTASRTDIFGVAVYDNSFGPDSGDYTLEIVQLDSECTSHVELSFFDTSSTAESIELRWQSQLETDHLGFSLSRAIAATPAGASEVDRFEPIGPELIHSSGDRHDYVYYDDDPALEPGVTYLYQLEAIDLRGDVQTFGPYRASLTGAPGAAGVTLLAAPQPNPFIDRTQLGYRLGNPGPVELTIYNVSGRVVRSLEQGHRPAGQHHAVWDGRNSDGTMLPSGIYFARLVSGDVEQTARLLLVR